MLWYTGQWFHDGHRFTGRFCPVDAALKPNTKGWREILFAEEEGVEWWDDGDDVIEKTEEKGFCCLIM